MYIVSEKPDPNTPHSCSVNSRLVPNSITFDKDGVMWEDRQCSICGKIIHDKANESPW